MLWFAAGPAVAQPRTVTLGGGVESLSGGFADGRTAGAQATLPSARGWARVGAAVVERFGQRTAIVEAGGAQDVGERWAVMGGASASTAGVVAPRIAGSALVGRRVGADRSVLVWAGGAARETRDGYRELDALGEIAVYRGDAVVQLGGRVGRSWPGGVWGGGASLAVTRGADLRQRGARLAVTREAWVVLGGPGGVGRTDVAFESAEARAWWRQPVGAGVAVEVSAGVYANPFYTRGGLGLGVVGRF